MKDFCYHCGRELNGNEDRCPECGTPTGFQQQGDPSQQTPRSTYVPYNPRPNGPRPGTVIAICVALMCLIGLVIMPTFLNNDSGTTHDVTVTIDEISIKDSSSDHKYGVSKDAFITITSNADNKETILGQWGACPTDGTACPITEKNKVSYKYQGDLSKMSFTVFLQVITKTDASGAVQMSDYVDIFDATSTYKNTPPEYPGCSGIVFYYSELTDGKITLKGDCDPLGSVKLSVQVS